MNDEPRMAQSNGRRDVGSLCPCRHGVLFRVALWFAFCMGVNLVGEAIGTAKEPEDDKGHFFETHIRPLLAERCFSCHGPKKQEAGLRLDSRDRMLAGGDSGEVVVVSGDVDKSRLLRAVRYEGDLKMPPVAKDRLSAEQVAKLTQWVREGMVWPKSGPPALSPEEAQRQARANHWSLQTIANPRIPVQAKHVPIVRNGIDAYVLEKLEHFGLKMAPPAERPALLRRVTFDLTGLPPTPEELDAFLADTSPDAYEKVIDRLLASPRYGEHWARHWLDVARYSDTSGYAFNRERAFPYAYTYRDYVIRAFNSDLPYNRFLLEQLAADQLPDGQQGEQLAGLGFLTVGRKFNNKHDDIDEQIDAVGRGLLGLTVACARCHDHKFDPIPTEDYYSLYGVFANTETPAEYPVIGNPASTPGYAEFIEKVKRLQADIQSYRTEIHAKLIDKLRSQTGDYLAKVGSDLPLEQLASMRFLTTPPDDLNSNQVERWRQFLAQRAQPNDPVWGPWLELAALDEKSFTEKGAPLLSKLATDPAGTETGQINPLIQTALAQTPYQSKAEVLYRYGKAFSSAYEAFLKQKGTRENLDRLKLSPAQTQLVRALIEPKAPSELSIDSIHGYLNRVERDRLTELTKKLESHRAHGAGAPPSAMSVVDRRETVEPKVAIRGNANRPGKTVPRQFLGLLAGPSRTPFSKGSGRLELAQAIAAEENPLTPRVIVNRLWRHHFGEAIVRSTSDFGLRSELPSHPELLEFLAWRLRESKWSLKSIQREIVSSAAYRQSSMMPLPGSDAESFVAKAREIDPENRLLWRMNRKRIEFEAMRDSLYFVANNLSGKMYGRSSDLTQAEFHRRAVYGFIDRQDLPGLFRVFDFSSPDATSPGRQHTIVPQQALFLLNSKIVAEQAERLSQRAEITMHQEARQRIAAVYRIVFSRHPSDGEIDLAAAFIDQATSDVTKGTKLSPWAQWTQLLLLSNEFVYID